MILSRRPTAPLAGLLLAGLLGACTGPSVGDASAGPAQSAVPCPTSQPAALPAGEVRDVTIDTELGSMVLEIKADLSPIAAGNFVTLASCGYYDGVGFHRTPFLPDGTPFVIQGGDPDGTGRGGPGYTIEDEPVTTAYRRGTVAMARTNQPDSVGSQFFIVLDDAGSVPLSDANTYQIIGEVTEGMETADAIFEASGNVDLPSDPILMDSVTVTTP